MARRGYEVGTFANRVVRDRESRLARQLDFEQARRNFLHTADGGRRATADATRILDQVFAWATGDVGGKFQITPHRHGIALLLVHVLPNHNAAVLSAGWRLQITNEVGNGRIEVTLWDGLPPWPGMMGFPGHEGRQAEIIKLMCDLASDGSICWRADGQEREFSEGELVEYVCKRFMDFIAEKSKPARTQREEFR